jgi:hypothetical protein
VCGISRRRAVSEMALLGTAASCVNLLAVTMPVQAAMLEPDVIRYYELPGYELMSLFVNTKYSYYFQKACSLD